jgi:dephospho-CoA kinase
LIFSQEQERLWLEQLLHPLIRQQIEKRIKTTTSPYCLIEIPLMPARCNYPYLNRVLLVQANTEQQIARFITRDKGSKEDALAILAIQAQAHKLRALADDVLMNTGSLEQLQRKVLALHEEYLKNASTGMAS